MCGAALIYTLVPGTVRVLYGIVFDVCVSPEIIEGSRRPTMKCICSTMTSPAPHISMSKSHAPPHFVRDLDPTPIPSSILWTGGYRTLSDEREYVARDNGEILLSFGAFDSIRL